MVVRSPFCLLLLTPFLIACSDGAAVCGIGIGRAWGRSATDGPEYFNGR